jgi:aspartate kinase
MHIESRLSVIKLGGSVLTGAPAYRHAARFIAQRLADTAGEKLLVIVSAELGTTDALQAVAEDFCPNPDPHTLDLLWSTGEIRSVALLTLALHALGVRATGVNVHQTGLIAPDDGVGGGRTELRPLRLRAALTSHDVVVAPGFLARGDGDALTSLGRGGSDLTAVLLAAGLGAARCELVKDVAGYYSVDPNVHPDARHLPALTFDHALEMAERGCDLVQRQALEAARDRCLPLLVRNLEGASTAVGG